MMRAISILLASAVFCVSHAGELANNAPAATAPTNRCVDFELKDQFDQSHSLKFPSAKPIVLTVADKKGSDGVAAWAHPLGVRFDERIKICGLADVSAVPKMLRGYVQGKFKKAFTHPAMLDWDGKICAGFGYEKNQPNIYLIASDGRILLHRSGPVSEAGLKEFGDAIEAELDSKR